MPEDAEADELAAALAEVGRRVRDAVRGELHELDGTVLRREGGDDVYGVDERADAVLRRGLGEIGDRWPGTAVVEGSDRAVPVGDGSGPWRYIVDPVDGTRPYLAGKRSAWVLLGAGRGARTLEDLEVGAAVEVPTSRAAVGLVAWARRGGRPHAWDEAMAGAGERHPVELVPRSSAAVEPGFVTVVRLRPGAHGPIGEFADEHLAGLDVYDDLVPCSGGQLLGVATGADIAVLDPRPLLDPGGLAAHPYDLAALVVARAAGVVVEALPAGPLASPLDTDTPVAWAAYANADVADRLRPAPGALRRRRRP